MVLVQLGSDDGLDRAAEGPVLRHEPQRPLLDLLQEVGLAVGAVKVDVARLLVDERLVPRRPEELPGVDQRSGPQPLFDRSADLLSRSTAC